MPDTEDLVEDLAAQEVEDDSWAIPEGPAPAPVLGEGLPYPQRWALAFLAAGYPLVPLGDDKGATRPFGWIPDAPREDAELVLRQWARGGAYKASPRAGLVLDGLEGSPALAVMDSDVFSKKAAFIARLPPTPLVVTTGREGGGEHWYYRRDPSFDLGSRTHLTSIGADYKSRAGYCVAPGSVHKSGLVYRAFWEGVEISPDELTAELFASLPVLPRKLVEELIAEAVAEKKAARGDVAEEEVKSSSSSTSYTERVSKGRGTTSTGLSREPASPEATFRSGLGVGETVSALAARLGDGDYVVACPHAVKAHRRDEKNSGTARLHVEAGKARRLVCFACEKVFTYSRFASTFTAPQKRPSPSPASKLGHLPTNAWGFHEATMKLADLDRGYISRAAFAAWGRKIGLKKMPRVVIFQIGMGRGKTELLVDLTRGGGDVRVTAPIRSLVAGACARFGLPSYLDSVGAVEGRAAFCTPSWHRSVAFREVKGSRSQIEARGSEATVHDEIEQQVVGLLGDHLTDSEARKAWAALVLHLIVDDYTFLLDAHAGRATAALLRASGISTDEILWVRGPAAAPRDVRFYESSSLHLSRIHASAQAGKRLVIPVHSEKKARALEKTLPLWQGRPTAVITKTTAHQYDRAQLAEQLETTYGHLIHTPIIGTGVDIPQDGLFDEVHGILCDSVGTGQSALQLLSRVRKPKDRTLYVSRLAGGAKPQPWESDVDQLLDWWSIREAQTRRLSGGRAYPELVEAEVDEQGLPRRSEAQESYLQGMAQSHVAQVEAGLGRVCESLLEILEAQGGKVERVLAPVKGSAAAQASKAARELVKEAQGEVRRDDVVKITRAADLPAERLEAVQRSGPKSEEDSLGLTRAALERTYGEGAADDAQLVRWDDDGRGRGLVRSFAHVAAHLEGGRALESVRRLDRAEIERGTIGPRLRHRALEGQVRAGLLVRLLGREGVSQIFSGAEVSTKPEICDSPSAIKIEASRAEALVAHLQTPNGGRQLCLLGLTLGKDAASSPMRFAGRLLAQVGLALESQQVRVGKERTRVYCVCPSSVSTLQEAAATYLEILRSGQLARLSTGSADDRARAAMEDLRAARDTQAAILDAAAETWGEEEPPPASGPKQIIPRWTAAKRET